VRSASQLLHAALGAPRFAGCDDHTDACWVCGGLADRTMPRADWMGAQFVGQNRARAWSSPRVCEPCACVTAWTTPATMPVPGRASKPGAKRDLMWRLFSVLYDDGHVTVANKGDKPAIRAWLRAPKRGPWFAAIADSGQKHVVPWAPVNGARGTSRVLFEEMEVTLGDWRLGDDMTALLTAGPSKDEIAAGEYRPQNWQRCQSAIESFETSWSSTRASPWWLLALWLSQRDEAAVSARMEIENAERRAKAKTRSTRSAGDSGAAGRVPRKRKSERAEALGHPARQDAPVRETNGERGGVDHAVATPVVPERADGPQLDLF